MGHHTCSAHSSGVDFEMPASNDAPVPIITPALLRLVRFGYRVSQQWISLLDENVNFSIVELRDLGCDVLSDELVRIRDTCPID